MQGVSPFAFQGFDVLSWLPDGIEARSGAWITPMQRVTVPSGAFTITAPALHPVHATKAIYRCLTRADHAPLWAWLAALLGRYTPFWCPTFQRDLEIVSSASFGTWVVKVTGFATMFAADPAVNYLYGFNRAGANGVAVKVLAAIDNGDGTETITYDTNVLRIASNASPGTIATSVVAASLLRFARLDDDTLTQHWSTREIVDVTFTAASITGERP